MSKNITIKIGKNNFGGWKSGRIVSSLLTLSDTFELSGFDVFGEKIKADDECTVLVAGEPIITGYIDVVKKSTNGNIVLMGRDKTRDLIDCQAITTSFLNQEVIRIVDGIAVGFGIRASGDAGPKVDQFIVARDETAADAINRLVTNYGMVITSNKDGNVVVREPGNFDNPGFAIKQGVNIRDAVGTFAGNKRFSTVDVIGQNALNAGFSASEVGDSPWTRPKRVILSDEVNATDCEESAMRIVNYTNGDACRVDCTITTLDYLPAGTALTFVSEVLGIDGEMLVETVSLEFDSENSSVKFALVSPEKYGGTKTESEFLK